MDKIYLSWDEYVEKVNAICLWAKDKNFSGVYGVPRGGLIPSVMISHCLSISYIDDSYAHIWPKKNILVVEDAIDTGSSVKDFKDDYRVSSIATISKHVDCSFEPDFYAMTHSKWLVFPYEKENK